MTFLLTAIDDLDLTPGTAARFTQLTGSPLRIAKDDPSSVAEVAERAADADGLLVSWRTAIPAEIFQRFPRLKYVGLAASAYTDPAACPVDLAAAAEHGVTVSSLGQYGDEATAEWVLLRMLTAARNLVPWRGGPVELHGKRLGVVGMGHMGRHVAQRAAALGMCVSYTGPRRKPEADAAGFEFLSLTELATTSDVISIHTPKGTQVFDQETFAALRSDALLINTSIGSVMDSDALTTWLGHEQTAFICDACVDPAQQRIADSSPNGLCDPFVAGNSAEMRQRKSDQLVENLAAFLSGTPIRRVA